jgi:predicted extracellular nuclease
MRFQVVSASVGRVLTVFLLVAGGAGSARFAREARAAAPFTAGNIVVYRVGDGVGPLAGTGNPVFLDEYTPRGTLVQSIPLPIVAAGSIHRLIASGTAISEGLLTRSVDGVYLLLAGYDAAIPTPGLSGTTAAEVPRVVARVGPDGSIDTSTAFRDFASGSNPRGAASTDGSDLWIAGGTGGVRFARLGSMSSTPLSTTVTNLRSVQIFAGQLYVSDNSGSAVRLGSVGMGLPRTSGQTITNLPGFSTGGSPYGFFFADLDGTPGLDTLYVADDTTSGSPGGITKYSLVSGTWISNGSAGAAADAYRGLTGIVDGITVTLFATRKGGSGANGGGELVSIVDADGYNRPFGPTPIVLASAAAKTAFRGVALAPELGGAVAPTITSQPADKTISAGQTATLTVATTGTAPLKYQWYAGTSGDTSMPLPGATGPSFTTPPLTSSAAYWVRVSNVAGSVDSNTATVTVTIPPPPCSASVIGIHDVQGATDISPYNNQIVTVRGAVVGDYEGPSPALRGFYLQDLSPDADPATSEGIFIFEASNANSVSLGQIVQVTGAVEEFQGQTEIDAVAIESCGAAASIAPEDVMLPVPAPVNGIAYLERFEGMLVRFHQTLYVTEHFQLGRFGQIVMSANGRLLQPTNVAAPGQPARAQQAANDLNRIIVDDELQNQNPDPIKFGRGGLPLTAMNTLRAGDTVTDLVGVMTYTWAGDAASGNAYRLRPVNALGGGIPYFQPANPRPAGPPDVGGRLKVAGMNVLNYFLTLDNGQPLCGPMGSKQQCRGAETAVELTRQQQKLNQSLLKIDADIVGMSELENTQDAQGGDVPPLADIVGRLNASLGDNVYDYVDTGVIGTDTVRVGLIYKRARVTPIGPPFVDNNTVHNRPPVAQFFVENATGERFTVVVNHFRSKGCSSSAGPGDTDQGDGQGCFNARRVQQAEALLSFVNSTVIPATGDADVLLIGDFNSYAKEDPIRTIEQGGFNNLVARFSGPGAYSYAFDGQWGYIDQALASASLLAQVTGASDYHINSDEPSVLDYNTNFKSPSQLFSLYNADEFRTADHDPVIIGIDLGATCQTVPNALPLAP